MNAGSEMPLLSWGGYGYWHKRFNQVKRERSEKTYEYNFPDTKREALKLGIPYGFVANPMGPGVERR
jgi:hypothetical protein